MPTPMQYPAWLQLPDGRSVQVMDAVGYAQLSAQGAVYNLVTPTTATTLTMKVSEISVNDEQVDARPVFAQGKKRHS